jgi:hypothetical protein
MTRLVVLALGAALACAACDEKKPSTDAPRTDAGSDKYVSADPKLEKALQQAVGSPSAAGDNGPPPTGVFAPGVADTRHARGVPTKVDVAADGSEPRVSLAPAAGAPAEAARSTSYGPAKLQVVLQRGRNPVAIDYDLLLGPAKKDDGGPDWLVGNVKKAVPSRALGQPPPGLEKDIAGLDGTEMRVQWTPDGRESDLQVRAGKAARAELEPFPQSAAEALVLATVPLPTRPIGVGAQWIAETRMLLAGVDVIAYRAFRVKSIDGDRLHVTLDVKAYATSKDVQLPGVPTGATLEQFEAQSQGELEVVRGEVLARKSDVQQRLIMVFSAPGGTQQPTQPGLPPGNVMTAQVQSQATLIRGEDLRAASRQP